MFCRFSSTSTFRDYANMVAGILNTFWYSIFLSRQLYIFIFNEKIFLLSKNFVIQRKYIYIQSKYTAYRNSWTLDARAGCWTLDTGRWTLNSVKTLKFKSIQSFGNNESILITSFLNSTLIKIFGHFKYENLSTVYSFQATLSNHLKISKIWWCGEGRSTWNGLIWSFVSVKAQTMRYILAVNFFHFFKHAVGQKKWFIWIRTLQLLPKKR